MARVNQGLAAVLSFCVAATAGTAALAQDRKQDRPSESRQSKDNAADPDAVEAKDTKLEKEVETRLEKDPVLKFQGLDATVMEGKVVLSGTTGSRAEKLKAARLATGVRGVSKVDNQILVRGSAEAASDPATPDRPRTTKPKLPLQTDEVEPPARMPPDLGRTPDRIPGPDSDVGRTPGRDDVLPPL
jgi:hypothetical protein